VLDNGWINATVLAAMPLPFAWLLAFIFLWARRQVSQIGGRA
jgi:hypothetical protein